MLGTAFAVSWLVLLTITATMVQADPHPIHSKIFAQDVALVKANKPFNTSEYMVPMRDGVELVSHKLCYFLHVCCIRQPLTGFEHQSGTASTCFITV